MDVAPLRRLIEQGLLDAGVHLVPAPVPARPFVRTQYVPVDCAHDAVCDRLVQQIILTIECAHQRAVVLRHVRVEEVTPGRVCVQVHCAYACL